MSCFCIRLQKDVVKTLDFRHCGLNFVPEEIYEYDETLQELYLDSNNIKDLPRSLFHCEFLRTLSVCDNDLCVIPNAVATLVNLKQLDISKNGIVELPDSIKSCKNLSLVEISVNPLGKLPEGFTQLVNLTQLYLNDTLLNYLPANFGRLVKLTVLELRENRLKALPRSMARLTELERLDLGMNEFRQLPEVIGFFTKLTELWVDSNKLTSIPSAIGNLKELVYFDASCNRIECLPTEIEGLDSLTDLHLSKNYLQELPKTIGQLSNLQNLKLDCNQLSFLPYSIGGLVSLEELILTFNDLEELPPSIGLLRKLTHLNADQNMLLELPSELGSCSAITLLSLHSNLLMTLPDEIGHISSLTVVNLSNNQLQYLPYKITKLKKLQALWLSENQSKPLIPLQSEMRQDLGKRVLTCFLFPQKHREPEEDNYQSDGESFHTSQWEEQRLSRRQIAFDIAESDSEHNFKRPPTPYPKEGIKRKNLASPQGIASKLSRSRGQRGNILPNYPSVDTSTRHGQQGSSHDGKPRRSRSPGSPISDSLHLFQADKEMMAKDKARLRGSFSSVSRQDSDTESVASSTRERVMGRREIRARMDRAAMSDTEAFIQSPVWSHLDRTNARQEPTAQNHTFQSPRSGSRSNSRGYESDRAEVARTPVRSPKVPQMQVGHNRAPRNVSVGQSRGYESDQVGAARTPLDVSTNRRETKAPEGNRNSNAGGSVSLDGRQPQRLPNRRSSGYSTDPERSRAAASSRESRMAGVKQKRDEMLPPPYYRVRQLRAGAQSQSSQGTPHRRHPAKLKPQSFKDYGWIDGQLPSTPEGQNPTQEPQEAPHNSNAEVSSASRDADKENQLMGNHSQTPNVSSRRDPPLNPKPERSRRDPTAYSDTELATGPRRNKPQPVVPLRRESISASRETDPTLNPTTERKSPVFDQTHDGRLIESGYHSSSRDRTFQDRNEANATAPEQLQQNDEHGHQGQGKHVPDDSRQRSSPVHDLESQTPHRDVQQPVSDHQQRPNGQADVTSTDASQSGRHHVADTQSRHPPNRPALATDEDGNRDYLRSLEGRQRQTATLPAQLARQLNPQGTHSLPRNVGDFPQQPNRSSHRPNAGDREKSSSLPRSEGRVDTDEGKGTPGKAVRAVSDRYKIVRGTDKKTRLHGGAPDYTASEPELRHIARSNLSLRELIMRDTHGPPAESRGGTVERRRSRSPVSRRERRDSLREMSRFPFGLTSSTPSVDGGSRPTSPTGSRPHSPDGGGSVRRPGSRPGSPKDLLQSQPPRPRLDSESSHPPSRQKDPEDTHTSRPSRLPLKASSRLYNNDSIRGRLNYDRRDSDASRMQQVQQQQRAKTAHSRLFPPPPYQGGRRDSLPDSLPTPIVGDARRQGGNFTRDVDPQALPAQGLTGQPSRIPGPDLWPQDSSGYASDPNDQGWKRASCSTPTSSVQGPSSPPMWRPGSDVTPPDPRPRHPTADRHDRPPPPVKKLQVVIYKNPGLGFSITGGKDAPGNPFRAFDWGIFVTKIQPGGPADGTLKPGDKLLEVNGRSYDNILHDEAVKLLRKTNPVSMVVQRSDQ